MLRTTCNVFISLILAVALVVLCLIAVPMLMGKNLYAVQTGSMAPTHPIGSVVVAEAAAPEEIAVGDVITYKMDDSTVTHRVMEIDDENGQFITQGDGNDNVDFYPVAYSQLESRVSYSIPMLGNLILGLRTPGGLLAMLWVAFLVLVLLFLPDLVDKLRAKGTQQDEAESTASAEVPIAPVKPAQGPADGAWVYTAGAQPHMEE